MKHWSAALLAICMTFTLAACFPAGDTTQQPSTSSETSDTQNHANIVTDMAGREVDLGSKAIEKVYCTDPVSAITLYTLAPDLLLGWNYEFNDAEKPYILPEYQDLPVYGMGDAVNLEAIIADGPELCIQMGSTNQAAVEKADQLSQQLGIPVLVMSSALEDSADVYRLLGDALGQEEQGEKLATYAENVLKLAEENQPEQAPTIYYGNGVDSLETAPVGSVSAEVFALLGADNVAKLEVESGSRIGISAEQLLTWNPQYIFVNGEPKQDLTGGAAAQGIVENPLYSSLQAVQNGNVYGIPKAPFAWVDRPMGPNRLIGISWVGSILYPEVYGEDLQQNVKEFYQLFYHMELNDDQLQQLMA